MSSVRKISQKSFQVTDFVKSMPNLRYTVTRVKGELIVTAREGCTEAQWDQHAIRAVKSAIDNYTVIT